MNDNLPDTAFDQKLRAALGSVAKPDFDGWQARHAEAMAYLNPVVSEFQRRKRRLIMRTTKALLAAAVCICVIWVLIPERETFAFAQTVKTIDKAQTISWTVTDYQQRTSTDGKRHWWVVDRSEMAFRQPGLFRATRYDDGNPRWVHIADWRSGKTLDFDLKEKRVAKGPVRYQSVDDPRTPSPFVLIANTLKKEPLELVGQRKVKDKTVNVFRIRWEGAKGGRSSDYWIDTQSKELVGCSSPGADFFDPETDPDRDRHAEKQFSRGKMLGTVTSSIVFDAKLDAELFNLTPPAGYQIVEEPSPPLLSEAELVEWLSAVVRVNNGIFPAALKNRVGFEPTRWSEIARKKTQDRTEAEQSMYNLFVKYAQNGNNGMPVDRFIKEHAATGSFRYVGVGVKLGSADRIVCWYQSKTTGKYRAVFGDLAVRDMAPKDLPLPVDH